MWWFKGVLLALLGCASLVLPGCGSTSTQNDTSKVFYPGEIECRVVLGAAKEPAELRKAFDWQGQKLKLGPPIRFQIKTAEIIYTAIGYNNVSFCVADNQRDLFESWTSNAVGHYMAILVEDQVVTVAKVRAPLPGEGVLTGGPTGFSLSEARAIEASLKGRWISAEESYRLRLTQDSR